MSSTPDGQPAPIGQQAQSLLAGHYLHGNETALDGHRRAARAWGSDAAHTAALFEGVTKGHFMWASPVLSNAPGDDGKIKGLPISCFLNMPDDSISGLNAHTVETRLLSIKGGGVGGHWNLVRGAGELSPGVIPFARTMDADTDAFKQGKVRRGSYAAYLPMSHPDIESFIVVRQPTGGSGLKCLSKGFHHGVCITNAFMHAVLRDEEWRLIDPHSGQEAMPTANAGSRRLRARELWHSVLEARARNGEPYLFFEDTANAALPWFLKRHGLYIHGSNLCAEIMLPTTPSRTAVCCLSSLNLETFDEWGHTNLPGDVLEALDNVLTYFIGTCGDDLWRARASAMAERSVGVGYMGWHAYLQSKGVAVESEEALETTRHVARVVFEKTGERSRELAERRGEPSDLIGSGYRNAHRIAVAPNANSASIITSRWGTGTSPGIEPWAANSFAHRTRAGTHLIKNRHLERLLESMGKNTPAVWKSITLGKGSVQHLDFLSPHEKAVFKTARELDQMWLVEHAIARQPFIDQGQSVNLFFKAGVSREVIGAVHMRAWEGGLKSLYYGRSEVSKSADAVGNKLERKALGDTSDAVQPVAKPVAVADDDGSCTSCQG